MKGSEKKKRNNDQNKCKRTWMLKKTENILFSSLHMKGTYPTNNNSNRKDKEKKYGGPRAN